MKKSLLAIGLSLTMVLAMATPAFAAISTEPNANGDGGVVENPGVPGVTQGTKESYNAATMTSKDGTTWQVANDDDTDKTAVDTAANINVWAKVVDSGSKIYKVDLAWGAMKFEYTNTAGQWNTTTHEYDKTGTGTAGWTVDKFLDGTNNKVAITNHSNNAIDAGFAYAMGGTAFNAVPTGDNAVIGNFFADNNKALAAALVLTGTHATGNPAPAAVADKLPDSKIAIATAEAYNDGALQAAGARTKDVFFAFSGAPDAGKGKDLDTFKKVGVITVTVTPNATPGLNATV